MRSEQKKQKLSRKDAKTQSYRKENLCAFLAFLFRRIGRHSFPFWLQLLRVGFISLIPLTALFSSVPVVSAQSQTTIGEIKKSLVCLCDCNMTVEACEGAMACQSAEKLTAEVQQFIDLGMDKPQILSGFISRYGEHILAAPTKEGFNLTAWILPFAALIIAGGAVVTVLRRWVRRPLAQNGKPKAHTTGADDPMYERELEEILRALE